MKLGKYSIGIGDRFAHQGKAQLKAVIKAKEQGVDITPVWNKSFREHQIVKSDPVSTRREADNAVKSLGWRDNYFVDADHVGLGNIDIFLETLRKRRQNLTYLMSKFKKFKPLLVSIDERPNEKIGPHAFPVIIQENNNFSRDDLVLYLEKKGIDSRSLFLSMPTQCSGFKFLGYSLGEFPNAEYIGRNGLHIGIHQGIEREDLDYFIEIIEEFLSKN